jgi:hypothetical protein
LTVNRRPQENAALQRKEAGNFVFPRCWKCSGQFRWNILMLVCESPFCEWHWPDPLTIHGANFHWLKFWVWMMPGVLRPTRRSTWRASILWHFSLPTLSSSSEDRNQNLSQFSRQLWACFPIQAMSFHWKLLQNSPWIPHYVMQPLFKSGYKGNHWTRSNFRPNEKSKILSKFSQIQLNVINIALFRECWCLLRVCQFNFISKKGKWKSRNSNPRKYWLSIVMT